MIYNTNIYGLRYIQLQSPQLAYQQNKKKEYLQIIKKNQIQQNKLIVKRYTNQYFQTLYDRVILSNIASGVNY